MRVDEETERRGDQAEVKINRGGELRSSGPKKKEEEKKKERKKEKHRGTTAGWTGDEPEKESDAVSTGSARCID